jgi:hypothetical protein
MHKFEFEFEFLYLLFYKKNPQENLELANKTPIPNSVRLMLKAGSTSTRLLIKCQKQFPKEKGKI